MADRLDRTVIARNLTRAMKEQGVGVRELSRRIRKRVGENSPGTSYGALQLYRKGEVHRPRIEVLEVAADVLGRRPEWLIWNEGAPTLSEEIARTKSAAAREALERESLQRLGEESEALLEQEVPRLAQGALEETWRRISDLISHWILDSNLFLRHPSVVTTAAEEMTSDPERSRLVDFQGESTEIAIREVAQLIRAPADLAGIQLEDLSDTHFNLYVSSLSTTIMTLITDVGRLEPRRPRGQSSQDFEEWRKNHGEA